MWCGKKISKNIIFTSLFLVLKRHSFARSAEHCLTVSKLSIPRAVIRDTAIPKYHTVFNSDMYVPPIRGSLICKKNDLTLR